MAVKMRKWRFQVAVKPLKIEGLPVDDGAQKFVAIEVKWKGEPKVFPLMAPRPKKELSSHKIVEDGRRVIQWDEEQWFVNTCCFSVVSDHKFGPWEISFNILYGDSKAKMPVIGRIPINISEIAWKMDSSSVEHKLPLSLQIDGLDRDLVLTVLLNIVEIREAQDFVAATGLCSNEYKRNVKARRRSLSLEEVSLDYSYELAASVTKDAASAKLIPPGNSDKKERWFSWTSRRFSFKRPKNKDDEKTASCSNDNKTDADSQPTVSSSTESFSDCSLQKDDHEKHCIGPGCRDGMVGVWEEKELISRDGQAKLKAPVFCASFDQRSDKAAGESACTALVAVISHWLHSNSDAMPCRAEFDNLIMQGSSEWRKLCQDESYVNDFPNKHFDLETVLRADIRPISISHNNSFVGFFGAETFEALKGVMSFDDIWSEISSNVGVHIVSWNDHFFVLKAEENAYYIIDTLGERLYEGCDQAFILRFDDKAVMQKHADPGNAAQTKTGNIAEMEEEEVICSGKECCREFIKRFLAAIPLKELEEEEKKSAVSYFSLHQRLQIEFNYSFLTWPVSSLISSPLSSLTTRASSPFFE